MTRFSYSFYGLTIQSRISLEPLRSIDKNGPVDTYINLQKLSRPPDGMAHTIYKPSTVYNKDFFYWKVDGIAQYLITDKHTIQIHKEKYSRWQDVRAFLIDTVLTVLLLKHDKFVFHASCVATKNGAFLFCSGAGNGKSTLAALLVRKGLRFVEDDRCLLHYNMGEKRFFIQNHFPVASVWKNIKAWDKDERALPLGPVRRNIQKFQFDIGALLPLKELPVKKLFLILMDNGENRIEKSDIKGISKVNVIKTFTHFEYLINGLGQSKPHFKVLAKIAESIPAVKIQRSQLTPIPDFVEYMYNEISS